MALHGQQALSSMIESVELIIRQPGHPDRVIRLREGTTRMGRAEDNDVILADVGVSRRHARVVVGRDQVRIEDMGSGNGTYYRGRRVESQALTDGDEVIIDPFVLRTRIKGAVSPEGTLDPGQEAGARLDVLTGPALARSSYPIGARGVTLGRSETRDIIIPDPASSRHHCSIFPQDGRYILRDMGSANGTYLNGNRIRETTLTDGDRVRIGNTEFRFVIGDSTKVATGVQTEAAWDDAGQIPLDHEPDMSLPVPDRHGGRAATPRAIPRRTSTMAGLLPMAFGGVVAVAVLVLMVLIGGIGLILLTSGRTEEVPPRPLTWQLKLPQDVPEADVQTLFNNGTEAIKTRDNKGALEAFYRSLQQQPGNEYGERLALLAGEFVVLDALEPALTASVETRETREARREQLLKESKWRSSKGYRAKKAIEAEFRDDPVVIEAWGWKPSQLDQDFNTRLTEGDEALAKHNAAGAVEKYAMALELAVEPKWRSKARKKLKEARKAMAATNAPIWREAVLAEAAGDDTKALQLYQQILAGDPDNASASLRIGRIKKMAGGK